MYIYICVFTYMYIYYIMISYHHNQLKQRKCVEHWCECDTHNVSQRIAIVQLNLDRGRQSVARGPQPQESNCLCRIHIFHFQGSKSCHTHTHAVAETETEQETDPNANIDTDTDTSIFLRSAGRVCELFDHYNTTVLQHTVTRCIAHTYELREFRNEPLVHCTATRSNESLVHCKTTDWNSTETQCNTLQMHTLLKRKNCVASRWSTATHLHCNMLQYAATHAPLKRWACVTEQTSWIAPHLPVRLATWRETVQKNISVLQYVAMWFGELQWDVVRDSAHVRTRKKGRCYVYVMYIEWMTQSPPNC